jgi:hypothetical protein
MNTNMAKKLEEAKNYAEEGNKVFTGEQNPAYQADASLSQLQTIVGTLSRKIEAALSRDPAKIAEKSSEPGDVNEALEILIESYNLFVLRKNILDGKPTAPVEVKNLNDSDMLYNTFHGHFDLSVISFGLKPVNNGPDNKNFEWENGSGLKVSVIAKDRIDGFMKTPFETGESSKYPVSAVAFCQKRTADVYLSYLVMTGQIKPTPEIREEMKDICSDIAKYPALAKMIENGNTGGIISYFSNKKTGKR